MSADLKRPFKTDFENRADFVAPAPASAAVGGVRTRLKGLSAPSAPTVIILLAALVVAAAGFALLQVGGSAPDATITASTNPDRTQAAPPPDSTFVKRTDAAPQLETDSADARRAAEQPARVSEVAEESIIGRPARDGAGVAILQREPTAMAPPPDAIDPGKSTVAVAETVEEILALEAIQRREVEADLSRPSSEQTAAIAPRSTAKVRATATTWVNLRAGPSDDAEVLLVVPGLAPIEAESGCNWCAVIYDGREGYIYKNFISYE